MPQVCAYDLVGPDERLAVRMKLGGGYIQLGQELPLEAGEGESEFHFLEHGGVDEAEGAAVAPLVISADRLARRTRVHRHFVIVFLVERKVSLVTFLETEDIAFRVDG